ncbi:Cytochrome P450 71D7 [Dendrobium catenatum]|nr:Cytochrome P450 71D7 [Dendrobium catenatum]
MDWAMAELIRHPEVMRKAQLEVRRVLNGRAKINEVDFKDLPYLNMLIKETLRLRTPAPILVPRYSTETVELGGYTIPAGSRIVINAWAIMREQNGWEDAERFLPERFENNQVEFVGTNYQYIPFGGGRRICPGISFSMSTMENVLANLLYHFDWKLPGGQNPKELEMKEVSGLSLTRKSDLFLIATPHN